MPKEPYRTGRAAFASEGRKIPVLQFIKQNPALAAALSKTVKDTTVGPRSNLSDPNNNNAGYMNPAMQEISRNTGDRIRDSQIVKEMLPDIGMALEILSSSIQSPNDMTTSEVSFVGDESIMSTELNAELLQVVKAYFNDDYKINQQLPIMLDEILGRSGAYVVAAIAESSIDDVINSDARVTMESFSITEGSNTGTLRMMSPIGYLGEQVSSSSTLTPRLAMESLLQQGSHTEAPYSNLKFADAFTTELKKFNPSLESAKSDAFEISITDNPDFLKLPQLSGKMRDQKMALVKKGSSRRSKLTIESEAKLFDGMSELSDDTIRGLVYKERRYNHRPVTVVKSQAQLNRRTIGAPLIMRIPAEAVIPIHVPGNRAEQLGFFILLDQFGYPIDTEDGLSQYNQLMNNMQYGQTNNGTTGNYAMQQNARADFLTNGMDANNLQAFGMKTQEYANLVEAALLQRLRSGVFPDGAVLSKTDELSRVMFARALSQQRTTILFVPAESMTYIAFDYDANGVGKSLLDDARILHSQRIQVSVANVMASIKNSIGLTKVSVQLDEAEVDVRKTIPAITDMVMGGRQNIMPMGVFNPTDVAYWATRSGLMFSFKGASSLPDVSIDYEEVNTNYAKPDTDLEELLQKRSHDSLRVPTELIDNANGPDFATAVAQNHIIFSRRVMAYQRKFTPQLTKHAVQVIRAHQVVFDKLREIVAANYKTLKPEFSEEEKYMLNGMEKTKVAHYVINKVTHAWVDNLQVTLPAPDNTTIKAQQEALEEYSTFVDKGLEAYLSTDIFNESLIGTSLSTHIDSLKFTLKAHAMRSFIVSKNILPELQDIFQSGQESTGEALNEANLFLNTATEQFLKFLTKRMIVTKAADVAAEKIGLTDDSGGAGSSDGGTTDTTNAGGNSDDDFGGDFGMDDSSESATEGESASEAESTDDASTSAEPVTDDTEAKTEEKPDAKEEEPAPAETKTEE